MRSVIVVLVLAAFGCDRGIEQPTVDVAPGFGSLSASAPPQTVHWGQLVGVWDCLVSTPGEGGVVANSQARWTWRYILDGHAVQDVYEGLRADESASFFGTGLRTYHPASDAWEISWTANSPAADGVPRITRFSATSEPDRVVMRRSDDPDWSTVFYDITQTTFAWASEPSGQSMECQRVAG